MATPPQGARNKASKIRKALAAGTATEIDQLWLQDYEEKTNGSGDWGRSGSSTKVKRTEVIEEKRAAEGTGTAAAAAASLALAAKEEGRRLDSLTTGAISALHEAVETYKAMTLQLLDSHKTLHETNVALLQSRNAEVLARTDAEADLIAMEKDKEGDPATAMVLGALAKHFGVELAGAAPSKKNGAAKKPAA